LLFVEPIHNQTITLVNTHRTVESLDAEMM